MQLESFLKNTEFLQKRFQFNNFIFRLFLTFKIKCYLNTAFGLIL